MLVYNKYLHNGSGKQIITSDTFDFHAQVPIEFIDQSVFQCSVSFFSSATNSWTDTVLIVDNRTQHGIVTVNCSIPIGHSWTGTWIGWA